MKLTNRHIRYISWSFVGALNYFASVLPASAQIVPDTTLPVNSTVTTTGLVHTINGGTTVGVNLYHSFQDFSVPTNNTAHFNNAPQIQNILSRVTGNSISNIDGTLKANGNANLFLLNPNGIVFGANAKLDIGGTFVGSTANSFKFVDGSEFSATNPQAPPILTMDITPGVQYGNSNQGATISNLGNLSAGKDLILNAGKLDLQGSLQAGRDLTLQAQDSVKIRDTAATPFWAVAGRDLLVQGNQSVDIFTLNNVNSGFWSGGNMVLRSNNPIIGDAHFFAGSNFNIEKLDGTSGKLLSPNDPVILASGDVTLGDYTGESLHILAGGSVTLGNVEITAEGGRNTTINPKNTNLFNATKSYADLATFTWTNYQAIKNSDGTIKDVIPIQVPITIDGSIQATLDVRAGIDWRQLDGLDSTPIVLGAVSSSTDSNVPLNADITVGNITVAQAGGLVFLTNRFMPNSLQGKIRFNPKTDQEGVAAASGDIRVYSRGGISSVESPNSRFNFSSAYQSSFSSGSIRNGGEISFVTDSGTINLDNWSFRSVSNSENLGDSKNAGSISFASNSGDIVRSSQPSNLDVYSVFNSSSISFSGNSGYGGAISFVSKSGNITVNNAVLRSASFSEGSFSLGSASSNGGAVALVSGTGNITLENFRAETYSYSNYGNTGNGGDIIIAALNGNIISSSENILNSTSLVANTDKTSGDGGDVILQAKNQISNLDIFTQSSSGLSGAFQVNSLGNLIINNLQVSTSKAVTIENPRNGSVITFDLGKQGRSGDVSISGLGSLTFSNTLINSTTQGIDPAGNISITSPSTVTLQNSQILSSTNSIGLAGSVTINADKAIAILDKSELNAQTTAAGKAGNITFNTPLLNLDGTAKITTTATATSTNTDGGGSITLNASTMNLFGTVGIFAETQGVAPAGILKLNPYSNNSSLNISLANNSVISASTIASGNGGDLILTAPQSIRVAGNGKLAVETSGTGKAGNISFTTSQLTLTDGVTVSASTAGTGKAGDISANVNNFTISNGAKIISDTNNTGNAGSIKVVANESITVRENSQITARTSSNVVNAGSAGDITFNTPTLMITDGSQVLAETNSSGSGGNITVNAPIAVSLTR
ncbi:MAG: filamentous hemagglutinin N-terminal domain-containing protein, partial [Pseudanabaenaceae cyanobacterium bins.39]|nr:filamentous hemagglutinin N-terminal domain-containing protein [Pseudanabaenaceae cyanobacterium bins.39]